MGRQSVVTLLLFSYILTSSSQWRRVSRLPDLYWNSSNPIFHISNTDHIMDVVQGGAPAPKINIICPHYPWRQASHQEQHVIYSVEKEEFETCRILRPQPRIIAQCTEPNKKKVFTFSFRSFSPMPGGIEFLPGQDYYFISTSGPSDVHNRVGGFCQSHNMKVVFKVLDPEMVAAAAAVEAAKSFAREKKKEEEKEEKEEKVVRINSEIKPIVSHTVTATSTLRPGRKWKRKQKKEKETTIMRSTRKPSELQKFLAKRGFSSSSSRVSINVVLLLFFLLVPSSRVNAVLLFSLLLVVPALPYHTCHITQLFPLPPR